MKYWTICVFTAILSFVDCGRDFYNIAHMCNNIATLDWAVQNGANAVEADLQFDNQGNPTRFYHGAPCDCTCMCPMGLFCSFWKGSICPSLREKYFWFVKKPPCVAKANAAKWLQRAGRKYSSKLALIWLDNKVKGKSESILRKSGQKIVKALDNNLFNNGYRGIVILGAEGKHTKPYFDEIVKSNSPNLNRIYLTMDSVKMSIARAKLDYPNFKNILYNTGQTACSPFHKLKQDHLNAIRTNVENGVFSGAFAWTYNLKSSMKRVHPYFDGIITNMPPKQARMINEEGRKLAAVGSTLPASTSSQVIGDDNDEMYLLEEDPQYVQDEEEDEDDF